MSICQPFLRTPYCTISSSIDITERKQTEDALRFHQLVLEETGRIAKIGGWSFEAATGEGFWTDEVARIHDLDPALPTSKNLGLNYYAPESRPMLEAALEAALEDGIPYDLELELVSAKGVHKWVRTIGHPQLEAGRVVRMLGSFQDITSHKQAEMALREKLKLQEQLEKTAATVPGMLHTFKLDASGQYSMPYASQAIEDLYGLQAAQVAAEIAPIFALIEPEDLPQVQESITASAASLQPWRHEFRLRHPVKGVRWLEGHSVPVQAADGSLLWHGFIQDITERKQAEAALRNVSQKNQDALAATNSAYWEFNPETGLFTFNERFYALHGITEADGFELSAEEFARQYVHPEFAKQVSEVLRRALEPGQATQEQSIDGKMLRSNGEAFWVSTNVWAERDAAGKVTRLRGVNQDITKRKEAEQAVLRYSQQLNAVAEIEAA